MTQDWERFKSNFRSGTENDDRYVELREPVVEDLKAVEALLRLRGSGDLPSTALGKIAERWGALREDLLNADGALKNHPGVAIEAIRILAESAATLHKQAKRAKRLAVKAERARRRAEAKWWKTVDRTLGKLDRLFELGAPKPEPMSTKLSKSMASLLHLVEDGDYETPTELVREMATGLDALYKGFRDYKQLRALVPETLSKEALAPILGWDRAAASAVRDGKPKALQVPLSALRLWLVGHDRVEAARALIQGVHPKDRFARLQLRVSDILDFPEVFASPAMLKRRRDVSQRVETILESLETLDQHERTLEESTLTDTSALELQVASAYKGASLELDALDEKLTLAAKAQAAHSRDMRSYYAKLRALHPRLQTAWSIANGVEEDELVEEREALDEAFTATSEATDPKRRDYAQALLDLVALVRAVDDIAQAYLALFADPLERATNPERSGSELVCQVIETLGQVPGLLSELPPETQLGLLRSMREGLFHCERCQLNFERSDLMSNKGRCPKCKKSDALEVPAYCANPECKAPGMHTPYDPCERCGSKRSRIAQGMRLTWDDDEIEAPHPTSHLAVATAALLSQMKPTEAFERFDEEKREALARAIRDEVDLDTADSQWATWVSEGAPYTQITKVLEKILATQCQIYDMTQKDLTRDSVVFKDRPVKLRIEERTDDRSTGGHCVPGFPTWIVVNTASDMFQSLRATIEVITHETGHAFQHMLIAKSKALPPFTEEEQSELLSDPVLGLQAQIFAENEELYVSSDDFEDTGEDMERLGRKAYRLQPMEDHAWQLGGGTSHKLLVPPPVESFASHNVLASKTWKVKSMTRTKRAKVTLTERHTIHASEWEGERPSDKQVFLEDVPLDGERQTYAVQVLRRIDDYTLMLDLDARDLTPETGDEGLVASSLIRLRLNESVLDI